MIPTESPVPISNARTQKECGRFFCPRFLPVDPKTAILPSRIPKNMNRLSRSAALKRTARTEWTPTLPAVLTLLILLACLLQQPAAAVTPSRVTAPCPAGFGTPPVHYTKDAWRVWFRGREVADAVPSSFVDLGDGYGKDAWKVFFEGRPVKDAAAQSFTVLRDGYARDAWRIYWCGRPLSDAAPLSFEVLGRGYARDAWRVWFCGRELPGASPSDFLP